MTISRKGEPLFLPEKELSSTDTNLSHNPSNLFKEDRREWSKQPFRLVAAIVLVSFGAAFSYGYNLAVINLTQGMLEDFVNGSTWAEHGTFFDETELKTVWSFIVSSFTLGGAIGGLICPIFAETFGRKKS